MWLCALGRTVLIVWFALQTFFCVVLFRDPLPSLSVFCGGYALQKKRWAVLVKALEAKALERTQ